jgi:hypothetical protein
MGQSCTIVAEYSAAKSVATRHVATVFQLYWLIDQSHQTTKLYIYVGFCPPDLRESSLSPVIYNYKTHVLQSGVASTGTPLTQVVMIPGLPAEEDTLLIAL